MTPDTIAVARRTANSRPLIDALGIPKDSGRTRLAPSKLPDANPFEFPGFGKSGVSLLLEPSQGPQSSPL
jgi:hypothetical protein